MSFLWEEVISFTADKLNAATFLTTNPN